MTGMWTVIAAIASFGAAALFGIWLVPFLKKIHFGQTIREEGPQWHNSKQGTPIMGGFMFIISSIVTAIAGYWAYRLRGGVDVTDKAALDSFYRMISVVIFAALFGLIGFIDDYEKAKEWLFE